MNNTQIERLARNISTEHYAYTWSQGRRRPRVSVPLLIVVLIVIAALMLAACSGGDPTPAPQATPTMQPAREFPLCGRNNFLCK